jgi:fructose-1,6-bisphosphatase I
MRPMTLIEYVTRRQQLFPQATGAFTMLVEGLALATKIISREVNQAGLGSMIGLTGRRNVQGEAVARLDEFSNDTLVRTLTRTGSVCAIGSEELAVPIRLPASPHPGDYSVVFDPLDGSSNIDYAVSVGSIFGVYRRKTKRDQLGAVEDLLQSPRELVAAGYAVYGSSTILVLAIGDDVNGFTLDPSLGEYLMSHPDIRVPARGKVLSVNTGNRGSWDPAIERTVAALERPADGSAGRSLRYVGSLVADAHRTLLAGGLFLYPADRAQPQGKLRLLYEAGPLAYVFERAGGAASDGTRRILDVDPKELHDRTPLFIGGAEDVARFLAAVAG